jgi:hypothetical protein
MAGRFGQSLRPAEGHCVTHAMAPFHPPKWPRFSPRSTGYKLHGKPMLYFAGFKEHYSLFAASGTFFAALEDELRGYELRKGTVQFPLTKPVPVELIDRIAKLRAAGITATAKKPLLGREKERRK